MAGGKGKEIDEDGFIWGPKAHDHTRNSYPKLPDTEMTELKREPDCNETRA
jgi:hypothetical protein